MQSLKMNQYIKQYHDIDGGGRSFVVSNEAAQWEAARSIYACAWHTNDPTSNVGISRENNPVAGL